MGKINLTIMSQKVYTFCDMDKGYSDSIKTKISEAQPGAIFIHSDFSDLADSATIRKCLSRMVADKEIRRIKPGIYDKPKYSNFLQENLPPDPDKVAKAIARNFHWTIAPCGDQAMNILGLSTQVPVVWTYLSDGPYKEYDIDKIKISFNSASDFFAISIILFPYKSFVLFCKSIHLNLQSLLIMSSYLHL